MSGIVSRFLGDGGRTNRVEALLSQTLIGGEREIAEELAARAEIISVKAGDTLIMQGGMDDDIYFVIAGAFGIVVNGQRVAVRGRGEHVGEMVLVEPAQTRSASVIADENSIVAKLSSQEMIDIATRHPSIYRRIATSLSRRLRERNRLVGQHRERIKVFIISSVEALPIARVVQNSFEHDPFLTTLWTDGVFRATSYTLEALEGAVDDCDFAIAVAHGEDHLQFRGQDWPTPRDNVVFELGLFMGKLGRKRAILMEPREDRVKLPSDLSGVTTIPYRYESGRDASASMAPACNRLREYIAEWGPFNG